MTERLPQATEATSEVVEQLAGTAQALSARIEGRPEFVLHHKADAATWSVTEILGHLVDNERLSVTANLTAILTTDNPILSGHDQDAAVIAADYAHADAGTLVSAFDELRSETVATLRRLTPEQWERLAHDGAGATYTLAVLARGVLAHDRDHLGQIAATLRHAPGANH